jgi:hypothetical protein
MGSPYSMRLFVCIPWLEALSRKSQDNNTLEKAAVIGSVATKDIRARHYRLTLKFEVSYMDADDRSVKWRTRCQTGTKN